MTAEVLDYVGGREDLQRGIIRTIGEPHQRFAEDKLRMLRAVRFAARFGYTIDEQTFAAIRELAPQIHQVSHERVRDEILKMLTEGHARRAFELLDQTSLLEQVLPEIKKMQGVEQPPQYHPEGDVWIHTLMLLEACPPAARKRWPWARCCMTSASRLRFAWRPTASALTGTPRSAPKWRRKSAAASVSPMTIPTRCSSLVANHMRFGDVERMKESTLKRFFRLPRFEEHLELHRLDCSSSHRDLSLYEFAKEKFHSLPAEQIRPAPLITGDDLIAAGYQPGPQFKELLTAVEDAQLEGTISTKEEAMELVKGKSKSIS